MVTLRVRGHSTSIGPRDPTAPLGSLQCITQPAPAAGFFFRGTFHPATLDPLMLQQSPESPPSVDSALSLELAHCHLLHAEAQDIDHQRHGQQYQRGEHTP